MSEIKENVNNYLQFEQTPFYVVLFKVSNNHAGWQNFKKLINMQDGIRACRLDFFLFSLVKIKVFDQKFQKSIKVQDGIRVCRLDFFKKIISFAA